MVSTPLIQIPKIFFRDLYQGPLRSPERPAHLARDRVTRIRLDCQLTLTLFPGVAGCQVFDDMLPPKQKKKRKNLKKIPKPHFASKA